MENDWAALSAVIGAASFLMAVITTVAAVSWRIRSLQKSVIEEVTKHQEDMMRHHIEAEHSKDAQGRTLRERVILIETSIDSIRRSIERVSNAP